MIAFFALIFLKILSVQPVTEEESKQSLLDVIYWEVKPYIFTNVDGQLDGIIPKMLEEAQYYCMNGSNDGVLSKFVHREPSRKSFYDLVRSNFSYGNGRLKNVSQQKAFWVPVLAHRDKYSKELENNKEFKSFQLVKSTQLAVIVPRYVISLPYKILNGIMRCKQVFILTILLAILTSIAIWLLERSNNKDFHASFIRGTGTGFWWSIVSMTSVGYGDVVPKSICGRFLALLWLFTGLMIACVMTATMTDVLSGIQGLDFRGKKVSVLENSYEEKSAGSDHEAIVVPAESYGEAIDMVRRGIVSAAMINADVAAWYQKEIHNDNSDNPLRVVELLPAHIYVNCYVPTKISKQLKKVFKCMHISQDEVYKSSIEYFQRNCGKEVLYIGTVKDFIQKNQFIQILTCIVCGMLFLGAMYELYQYKCDGKMLAENKVFKYEFKPMCYA